MTNPKRLATGLTGILLAAGLLAGCTSEDGTPGPAGTGSAASPSGSQAPDDGSEALRDRSSEVLADPPQLETVATAQARPTSSFRGSTFTMHALTRSDTATVLTYSVTGGAGHSSPTDSLPRSWEKAPVLLTPTHAYRVVTFQEQSQDWAAVANPQYRVRSGEQSGPVTMLYPPLPRGTVSVTVRGAWFGDVVVPVTDVTAG